MQWRVVATEELLEYYLPPKMIGFVNEFKEADLRLAESGGAISVGRDGYGMTCSDAVLEWAATGS